MGGSGRLWRSQSLPILIKPLRECFGRCSGEAGRSSGCRVNSRSDLGLRFLAPQTSRQGCQAVAASHPLGSAPAPRVSALPLAPLSGGSLSQEPEFARGGDSRQPGVGPGGGSRCHKAAGQTARGRPSLRRAGRARLQLRVSPPHCCPGGLSAPFAPE